MGRAIWSPTVRVWGGSKAAKKGRKVVKVVAPPPVLPRRVEAATPSCQVVMVSAMGKRMLALPSSVVRTSGRQRRVSGKYSRMRGVLVGGGGGGAISS